MGQQQQQQQQVLESKQQSDMNEIVEPEVVENENNDNAMKEEMVEMRMKTATQKLNELSSSIESASSNELIKVALRPPGGKRVQHTFCNHNKVESLFDFANTFNLKVDDEYIQ